MEVEMTGQKKLFLVLLVGALLFSWGCSQNGSAPAGSSSSGSESIKPFLGRWDLTVKTATEERPSWIEITEEQGQAKGLMTGFWGHATPTGEIQIKDGEIEFLAPKGAGYADGTELKAKLDGEQLAGTATDPKDVIWQWTGRKAPSLERTGVPEWGKPVRLFNGKNLDGWRFSNPAHVWSVKNGTLVKTATSSEIISTSRFEDFKLHVEFKCEGSCNSGVYLRGRYEVQIAAGPGDNLPPNRSMGAVYGFLAPEPAPPATLGKWHNYDITLVGRTLTVVYDGQTIIDQREIPGITGGALDSNEGEPGPIYFQGGEHGQVAFRNIVITPAK
jgi:3-keto-disaccharide hydrolase